MNNTNTDEPAFPQHGFDPITERFTSQGGMTLRDYFAAKAMLGILYEGAESSAGIAGWAYEMADAMLKAREA
jgi:hypothetical protein